MNDQKINWVSTTSALTIKDGLLYIQKHTKSGRQYASFNSIQALSNYLQSLPKNERVFNEWINNPFRKFVIDFDYDLNNNTTFSFGPQTIINVINSVLDNSLDCDYDKDPIIFNSSRDNKISYHFVYNIILHYSFAKKLAIKIQQELPNVDTSVYGKTQHLRLYGSLKRDKNGDIIENSTKALNGDDTDDIDWNVLQYSLLSVKQNDTQFVEYIPEKAKTRSSNVSINSDSQIDCSSLMDLIIPENHSSYSDWITIGMTLYNIYDGDDVGKDLWDNFSSKMDSYDDTEIDSKWNTFSTTEDGYSIGTLKKFAKEDNPEKYSLLFPVPPSTPVRLAKSLEKIQEDQIDENPPEFKNDLEVANKFVSLCKDSIFTKSATVDGSNSYTPVVFNATTNLWEIQSQSFMVRKVMEYLEKYYKTQIALIEKKLDLLITNPARTEADILALQGRIDYLNACRRYSSKQTSASNIWKTAMPSMVDNEIQLDAVKKPYLVFKNGILEMDKLHFGVKQAFRPIKKEDYIMRTLSWNFNLKKDANKIKYMQDYLRKLQPDDDNYNSMLRWKAYCTTPDTHHQKMMFNIGGGGNGKSALEVIHNTTFDLYSAKLDQKTFTKNNSKQHKHLHILFEKPIRSAYIEELPAKRLDSASLKDFIDGSNFTIEVLFSTMITKELTAKLTTTSNYEFNVKNEESMIRRGLCQFYKSKFVKKIDENIVDPSKHIYLAEENTIDDEFKNAYLRCLIPYISDYYKNSRELRIHTELYDNFRDISEKYDQFKTKFEDTFTICANGKVQKDIFISHMGYDPKMESWVLREATKIGLVYNKNARSDNKRGCFIGISLKEDLMEEEEICETWRQPKNTRLAR